MISKPIYIPEGKAKEYGDFAINIYDTCNHGCTYCYAKMMHERWHGKGSFAKTPEPRRDIAESVRKQLEKEKITGKLIHLCFTCDPYPAEIDTTATREIIQLLKDYGNHVQILTKGGKRAERDFDLLDENDWFGITYCGYAMDDIDVVRAEPNTGNPRERLQSIKRAKECGIKTWVSFEPIIGGVDVLYLLENHRNRFDKVKIGKMNYHPSDINWKEFGLKAEAICIQQGLSYYIKESLRKEMEA